MKVFFVTTVGRQVEGELVIVRFEKCFTKASKADEFVKTLTRTITETITTPSGPVSVVCERDVHELELTED
jgi:hypothetical protein